MSEDSGKPISLNFSPNEVEIMVKISSMFVMVKEFELYFEEIDLEHKSLFQVREEFRNGLDHVMRVCSCKLGLRLDSDGGV